MRKCFLFSKHFAPLMYSAYLSCWQTHMEIESYVYKENLSFLMPFPWNSLKIVITAEESPFPPIHTFHLHTPVLSLPPPIFPFSDILTICSYTLQEAWLSHPDHPYSYRSSLSFHSIPFLEGNKRHLMMLHLSTSTTLELTSSPFIQGRTYHWSNKRWWDITQNEYASWNTAVGTSWFSDWHYVLPEF